MRKMLWRIGYSVLIERFTIGDFLWPQRTLRNHLWRMRRIYSRVQPFDKCVGSIVAVETYGPPIHVNPPAILCWVFFNEYLHRLRFKEAGIIFLPRAGASFAF